MCVYSLNVHRTRRVCVRRGGASRRSARRSEKATSTSRFRAWNCLASIYRGTEREGTVGPEGVAAADGKGWLWSMVCTDDGRFVVDHVIRILSSRTYTPSLIGPITQPFPLFFFFFQPLLRTFSFHPFLSFSHFFGLSIIGSFLPSGSAHTSPWENFKFSFQARFLFYITLLLIAVCVGVPSFRVLGVLLDFGRGVLVCFYSN